MGNVLLMMGIISLIGMFGLYRVFQIEKSVAGIVGCGSHCFIWCIQFITDAMVLPLLFMIVLLAVYVFSYPKLKADQEYGMLFALF